ncbi:MAG: double-strand break repair helicase AddA [Pseudomonadota bacterium]
MMLFLTPQQKAAVEPAACAWVEASAGTGKTHVLTARLLRLMLAGGEPARILALTFTKAAAAEMANRVLDRLGRWATLEEAALGGEVAALLGRPAKAEDLACARGLFTRVLNLPQGLAIQTIHAFCQSLLGRFPVEAGLPPRFQVMDERTASAFLGGARDALLARARADAMLGKALDDVVVLAGEQQFSSLMAALVGERARLARLARQPGALGLEAALKRALGLATAATPERLIADACAEPSFDRKGLEALARLLAQGSAAQAERAALMAAWLEAPAAQRPALLQSYGGAFLTQAGTARKPLLDKKAAAAHPHLADVARSEAARLEKLGAALNCLALAARSAALLQVGLALAGLFEEAKLRHGLVDYDDLIARAAELLARADMAAWVLYKLDGGIDHILIDEAQDTNPEQWQVIDALAAEFFAGKSAREKPRSVFAVGDVKQSIFGFQRAAPRLFNDYRQRFAAKAKAARQPFEDLALDLSFRSTDAVLHLVDAVFAGEAARGLSFSERRISHRPSRTGQAGQVELWPTVLPAPADEEESDGWRLPLAPAGVRDPEARLANDVASAIAGWIGRLALASRGRPAQAGDFMILVRRRTAFVDFVVRALKSRGVPVAGVDRFDLLSPIAVQDLMALAQVAVLPEDDLSLACVLKGPFIGLDEAQLFTLAHGREGSLWQALAARRDEDEAFRHAWDFLSKARARADYGPPYEFFEALLLEDGGRRALAARLGAEAEEAIDEFLIQALAFEATHPPSLDGFLAWLRARASEVKRDPEDKGDAVRILTVHGAKGLQAPIVILPDSCQVPKDDAPLLDLKGVADGGDLFLWYKRAQDAIGPAAAAKAARAAEQMAEYKRLLYVALTRAEDRLIVTGWEGSQGRAKGCWYDLVADGFARLAGVQVEKGPQGEDVRVYATAQTAPPDRVGARASIAPSPPLADWMRHPPPPEPAPPRPLAPSAALVMPVPPAASPVGVGGEGEPVDVYRRGRLLHRLLQYLPDVPPARRKRVATDYLARQAPDWPEDARSQAAREVLDLLARADLAALFGPGSRAEVALAGVVGGVAVSGQVDRLAITGDRIIIADYKTNRVPPATLDAVPRAYVRQLAAYAAVLGQIYPQHRQRALIIWTTEGKVSELPEALLRAHAP